MKDETEDRVSPQRLPVSWQWVLKPQPAMKPLIVTGELRRESSGAGSRTICVWIRRLLIGFQSVLKQPCHGSSDGAGRALSQLLMNPQTDLAMVRTLKDYAKALSLSDAQGPEHTAAIAVYYAAIASALVFHGRKITRHSYETLRGAFSQLAEKNWLPREMKELFRRGREACG